MSRGNVSSRLERLEASARSGTTRRDIFRSCAGVDKEE
jgi:hypothetical protein